jgi:hypothetical protein
MSDKSTSEKEASCTGKLVLEKGMHDSYAYSELGVQESEKKPLYCQYCYDNGKKLSILQRTSSKVKGDNRNYVICVKCKVPFQY